MASNSRNILAFLELPRELRDMVYDLSLENHDLILRCKMRVQATDVANVDILAISRRVKMEYDERAARKSVLKLYDDADFRFSSVDMPLGAMRVPDVRLNLVTDIAGTLEDKVEYTPNHTTWIQALLKQHSCIRQVSIEIHCSFTGANTPALVGGVLNASFWSDIPKLQALHLRDTRARKGERSSKDYFDFSHEDKVVMEWSSATRKLEMIKRP
ncbi:hypothetical protein DOTSEDRAFT_39359 [Dothistroma septosporum NZE10]|uniref:Uncharacterized protein n=1 Tax=Dothistroma septosporum (strain NZE10 / CBS 128990) TaxID=675120 RepID=N1PC27_DOTSN|nr:hypothetical protein DOTSEDRAFT_39359 [Dothistroma septosporum NZE10]